MAFVVIGQCLIKDICETCAGPELCPTEALQSQGGISFVDTSLCIDCGICEVACPHGRLRSTTPIFANGRWKMEVPQYERYVIALNDQLAQQHGSTA